MKNVFITILAVLVLGLGGYLVYDKVIDKKDVKCADKSSETINNTAQKKEIYTYKDVAGVYTYTSDVLEKVEGNDLRYRIRLELYENGTFSYTAVLMAPRGYIGNYIIVGDEIILNYLFQHGSDAGLHVQEGTKTLVVNFDKNIVDKNSKVGIYTDEVVLKKSNEALDESFSNMLNNYQLENNAE